MSREQSLWNTTKGHLTPYGKLVRIESPITKGIPDVCYTMLTITGWFELKYIKDWPKRESTTLKIDHLKLEQVLFMEDWDRAGGQAHLLLQVNTDYFLLRAATTRSIYEKLFTKTDIFAHAIVFGSGSFPTSAILRAIKSFNVPSLAT